MRTVEDMKRYINANITSCFSGDLISFIDKQAAEIAKWKADCDALNKMQGDMVIARQQQAAEIERLTAKVVEYEQGCDYCKPNTTPILKKARAEIAKLQADIARLKLESIPIVHTPDSVVFDRIWEAIKHWDADTDGQGYHGVTGDDVRLIIKALKGGQECQSHT
jgi:hypothetical protein